MRISYQRTFFPIHRGFGLLLLVLLLNSLTLAQAQRRDTITVSPRAPIIDLDRDVTFEISPYSGLVGKNGALGLHLSMNHGSLNLEISGAQVLGKQANLYPLSLNGVLNLSTRSRLIPYGTVGVGLLLTVPTATIGDEVVTTIGLNFGAGARYYFTKAFGLRFEIKEYMTNVRNKRDDTKELMLFQEITLGITFMIR